MADFAPTDLATLLSKPIRAADAFTDPAVDDFLQDLQANILKSHGRHHTAQMFLSFKGMSPGAVATLVRTLGKLCTSAARQLSTSKSKPPYLDGGVVYSLMLSATGFKALGHAAKMPTGAAFQAGMAGRQTVLADPPRSQWNAVGWRDHTADALFLIADADPAHVTKDLEAVEG